MIVRVEPGSVELLEPDNVKSFYVEVRGGADVAAVLDAAGAGRLADDGDHAHITIDWVKRAAVGRVGPDWDADFGGMLDFARTKGWIVEGDGAIVAHLERP